MKATYAKLLVREAGRVLDLPARSQVASLFCSPAINEVYVVHIALLTTFKNIQVSNFHFWAACCEIRGVSKNMHLPLGDWKETTDHMGWFWHAGWKNRILLWLKTS